jgi:hypothetical protein
MEKMIFPDTFQWYNFPSMFQIRIRIRIQESQNYRTKKKKKKRARGSPWWVSGFYRSFEIIHGGPKRNINLKY